MKKMLSKVNVNVVSAVLLAVMIAMAGAGAVIGFFIVMALLWGSWHMLTLLGIVALFVWLLFPSLLKAHEDEF